MISLEVFLKVVGKQINLFVLKKLFGNFSNTSLNLFIYSFFYITFNSQGPIAPVSLQVEETSAYCTVNHRASASNYQLSNMKRQAQDSNRWPQRLEARTLTATPLSPLTSLNKSSWSNWLVLKRTDRCMLLPPG